MIASHASLFPLLEGALAFRLPKIVERQPAALRLFNGFTEGHPELVVDLYADTLVIFDYAATPQAEEIWPGLVAWYHQRIP
ncbi:SAM-dependent methyltransferase, partial [bacterium]